MTTYNTYQEAKIANPECDIYQSPGTQRVFTATPSSQLYFKCNPADHCMTNNEFLSGGNSITKGDIVLDNGRVFVVSDHYDIETYNSNVDGEDTTFILRAAALERSTESVVKGLPKRVKVEYERVDFVDHWEYFKLMSEEGDLYVHCTPLSYEGFGGDNVNLANALHDGSCIYRRIETEITERDEFIEKFMEIGNENPSITGEDFAGLIFDKLVGGE